MKTIFAENEIPYKKFESIGFSQEMVDDLPEVVMNKLLSGNWTPILPIRVDLGDGVKRTIQARLKLERRAEGVDILIAPRSVVVKLSLQRCLERNSALCSSMIRRTGFCIFLFR